MKKVFVLAALIAFSSAAYAQDAETKTEQAVDKTKAAGRKAGKEIKKDAKVVGEKTKDGAEYVGEKTKEGAEYVGDGVEKGAKKAKRGTEKAYNATKDEAKEIKRDIKKKTDDK